MTNLCQSAVAGQPCPDTAVEGQVLCQKHIDMVKALRCKCGRIDAPENIEIRREKRTGK
jgi:hypothetical protein